MSVYVVTAITLGVEPYTQYPANSTMPPVRAIRLAALPEVFERTLPVKGVDNFKRIIRRV